MFKVLNERGAILIYALLILVVLGILGTTLLTLASADYKISTRYVDSTKAYYAAESKINLVLYKDTYREKFKDWIDGDSHDDFIVIDINDLVLGETNNQVNLDTVDADRYSLTTTSTINNSTKSVKSIIRVIPGTDEILTSKPVITNESQDEHDLEVGPHGDNVTEVSEDVIEGYFTTEYTTELIDRITPNTNLVQFPDSSTIYVYGEEEPDDAEDDWEPRYTFVENSSGALIKTIINNKDNPLFIIGNGTVHLGRSSSDSNSNGKIITKAYGVIHLGGNLIINKSVEFNGLLLIKGTVNDDGATNWAKANGFMVFYLYDPITGEYPSSQQWRLQKLTPSLDDEYRDSYKMYLPYSLETEKIKEIVN